MEILLNGRKKEIEPSTRLNDLLKALQLDVRTVVIELNEQVIKRENCGDVCLQAGDRLEVLHFVGGG